MRAWRELAILIVVVSLAAVAPRQLARPAAPSPSAPTVYPRPPANLGSAVSLQKERKWREAIEQYSGWLAQHPDDDLALFSRGTCYTALEMHDAAIADYQAALVRDPANPAAWNNLAWELCEVRRYNMALGAANRAVKLSKPGERASRLDTMAYAQIGLEHYADALKSIDEGLRLAPTSPFLLARRRQVVSLMAGTPASHPRNAELKERMEAGLSGQGR